MQIHSIPLDFDSHLHEFANDKAPPNTLQKCSELGTEETKRNSSKMGRGRGGR